MDQERAKQLGQYIRDRRTQRGLSTRQLAGAIGVDMAQIVRLENGTVATPRGDALARIAEVLEAPLADIYGLAGYTPPNELPSFTPYLRAKYSDLPPDAVAQMERYFDCLARKYGSTGPASGEDER